MKHLLAGRWLCLAGAVSCALMADWASPTFAQTPNDSKESIRATRLEEMAGLVGDLRVIEPTSRERKPIALRPEPLHRWTDPTRELGDGALWAFGAAGRPIALATLELYGKDLKASSVWSCELISLAPGPLVAEGTGQFFVPSERNLPGRAIPLKWTPKQPGLSLERIPEAPAPATAEADRLRQMKTLAARFSAHQGGWASNGTPTRSDLRLLPRPSHRYADPAAGIVDGACFLFVYGTNPELLLLIEAQKPADGAQPASWTFGCARLSTAPLALSLDGKESWIRPHAQSPNPEEPYYFVMTARPDKD